jgi:lipopolysaccharide transport system ATP-binding protein
LSRCETCNKTEEYKSHPVEPMSVVLRVENLWKQYRLGVLSRGALYRDVQSWMARLRGREDPNSPVAMGPNRVGAAGDRVWALRDVSLEVKEGEVLGIIGRNGAGKSTLLKIISRVTGPTRGCVKIKGRVASLLEVGTGFHPELTGRENIFLNGAILGMTVNEIRQKFDEIVDFSGVERYIDTPVKRYSSGMHVRLAFAVAAHLEPEILLVDEVLAVGDADFQKKCLSKMDEVTQQDRTVLFVSHNMDAISTLCREALWIEDGGIYIKGPAGHVVGQYIDATLKSGDLQRKSDVLQGGHFRFQKVTCMDREGNMVDTGYSRGSLNVVMEYTCVPEVRSSSLVIAVVFGNSSIKKLFACPKEFCEAELPLQGRFTCRIPALPLVPGVYEVRCIAWINWGLSDRVERLIRVIESSDVSEAETASFDHDTNLSRVDGLFLTDFQMSFDSTRASIPRGQNRWSSEEAAEEN